MSDNYLPWQQFHVKSDWVRFDVSQVLSEFPIEWNSVSWKTRQASLKSISMEELSQETSIITNRVSMAGEMGLPALVLITETSKVNLITVLRN